MRNPRVGKTMYHLCRIRKKLAEIEAAVEIEYILNNLSLAMYAKLGGIPWTLAPNTDLAHEIVVGIGSARLTDSRRGAGESRQGDRVPAQGRRGIRLGDDLDQDRSLARAIVEVDQDDLLPGSQG